MKNIGSINLPSTANAIGFDGRNIWINTYAASISRFQAGTATLVDTLPSFAIAAAMAFDGTNMWVVSSNNPGTISKRDAITGTVLATYTAGAYPTAAIFDGANLWVANDQGDTLTKLPFAK
jgi:DNA-binding beta-propeller fold protein YncE